MGELEEKAALELVAELEAQLSKARDEIRRLRKLSDVERLDTLWQQMVAERDGERRAREYLEERCAELLRGRDELNQRVRGLEDRCPSRRNGIRCALDVGHDDQHESASGIHRWGKKHDAQPEEGTERVGTWVEGLVGSWWYCPDDCPGDPPIAPSTRAVDNPHEVWVAECSCGAKRPPEQGEHEEGTDDE